MNFTHALQPAPDGYAQQAWVASPFSCVSIRYSALIGTFASSTTCQKVRSVTPEQCQKLIIDQLEQLTDKKLLLAEAESLSTHATLRVAGVTDPAHVFRYRSNLKQHLPYLVASQCGLVLRILQTTPPLRFDLTSTHSDYTCLALWKEQP
jgi:hypothetical protein